MDVQKILNQVLGGGGLTGRRGSGVGGANPLEGVLSRGNLGSAAAGGLLGYMLGGSKLGRGLGGSTLRTGGALLLAGLAYKAWQDYQAKKPASGPVALEGVSEPPSGSGFHPAEEADSAGHDFRLALVQAMIAAAKSDGHIDQAEHQRLQAQIESQDLSTEEKGFLLDAFTADADPIAIARLAKTREQAAELYLASRLSIDPDDPQELKYLERLSGAMGLPRELVGHLDARAEGARGAAAQGGGAMPG